VKIFVTGSTGFLGGYFVQRAVAEGAEVMALVRPSSDTRSLPATVSLSVGDLNDKSSLAKGMTGCEAVVHIASPKGGWKRPKIYQTTLLGGTQNVVTAMKESNVRQLIYLSTISVHGLDPLQGKDISAQDGFGQRLLPYDYYSQAKIQAEQIVQAAHESGLIEATVLRPGWLYGPGDEASYGRLADWMRHGLALRIGSGRNRLPLVYVENVAACLWAALAHPSHKYRVTLYAFDGTISQNDYLASLRRATSFGGRPLYLPTAVLLFATTLLEHLSLASHYRLRAFLTRYYVHLMGSHWHFQQSQLAEELGYVPQVDYRQGLALTEDWYRASRHLD